MPSSPSVVDRSIFLAEAKMASGIKHPNVREILDLGEDRGTVYLVMESIDGEPLSRLEDVCIETGRTVPCGIAARIVAQAARGLHAAHELKTETGEPSAVIHRDVSPQNILVTCEGIAKIVDFGVAKAAVRETPTTAAGIIKGKVDYLAPEQIEASEIDFRVDVFALGIVLYELVAGVRPFSGQTDLATLLAIASPEPAPPLPVDDSSARAFPVALQAIVARALEKDPAKRHGSMRELAVALEEFADEEEATVDAVGAFVTEVLGEERASRRRAMREAAREADSRSAREAHGPPVPLAVVPAAEEEDEQEPEDVAVAAAPLAPAKLGASSPRNLLVALVLVIGVTGVTFGALSFRALRSAEREPSPPESRLSISSGVVGGLTPPAAPSPLTALQSASALASASASPRAARPAPITPKPTSSAIKSPVPVSSAPATKRGPLDGWD